MKWTDEKIALLGTDTDENIAKRLDTTRSAVKSTRHKKGIPSYRKYQKFENGFIKTIKENNVKDAAKKTGLSEIAVIKRRKRMGINNPAPSNRLTSKQIDQIRRLLGKESDYSIARKYGVTQSTIYRHRKILGIAAHKRNF